MEDALEYIAENLREADRQEIEASSGDYPMGAVFQSWQASTKSWLILDRTGLPIGIMGVAPHPTSEGLGMAWMVGTDGVAEEALSIARQTRRYVEEMHEDYPILWNFIDARNELSLKWLEWSGFIIADAHLNFGPEGRLFYEFIRTPE